MINRVVNFALEAGVLDPLEGCIEEDDVEIFARYIIEEVLDVIRNCENPCECADSTMIDEEWRRGQIDACHAIKAHFGMTEHWLYRENGRLAKGDQDLSDVIEERKELITVLERILETGLPRNRERAEKVLKKIEERQKEEEA